MPLPPPPTPARSFRYDVNAPQFLCRLMELSYHLHRFRVQYTAEASRMSAFKDVHRVTIRLRSTMDAAYVVASADTLSELWARLLLEVDEVVTVRPEFLRPEELAAAKGIP